MEEGKDPYASEANPEKMLPEKLNKRDGYVMALFEHLNTDWAGLYVTVPWLPQEGQRALMWADNMAEDLYKDTTDFS